MQVNYIVEAEELQVEIYMLSEVELKGSEVPFIETDTQIQTSYELDPKNHLLVKGEPVLRQAVRYPCWFHISLLVLQE